ncbi:ABC transporter permease subunit [Nocardioides sp. LMS-CY]|uniref:ABC transporter permease subunit n=1 Tax=Nocardioides sp. (strain LMS-CY) TaxID=2840457 RepID=UPI001C005A13|nr:ABC transporter permease subunit [Nocardioides sp. LMS-CY]QWF22956.1 ABC transporter permease subunit [Nocardioides sp. LMS-CY]
MRQGIRARAGSLTLVGVPFAFVCILFVVPALVIVARSLEFPHFSLENYRSFTDGPAVRQATINTFMLALQSSLVAAAIGCVLIAGFVTFGPRWKAVIVGALLLPFVASELVRIVSWLLLLGPEGPLADLLANLGIHDASLLGGRVGALIGMVHVELPFFTLAALPTVLALDSALGRAATSLGANKIQRFLSVTLPLALPGVVAAWALTFVLGLGYYATPVMLGGVKEQTTLQALILNDIGQGGSWNHAAALGVLLVVVALLGFMILAWAGGLRVIYGGRSDVDHRSQGGVVSASYQRFAYSDRLWRGPGALLETRVASRLLRSVHLGLILLVLLYLAAPTLAAIPASLSGGTLVELTPDTWSTRWYVTLFQDPAWSASLRTSLLVSIPAAALATAIGLCAAIGLVRRYHGVGTRYLTTMLMPMIMPIQVTALGLFFVLTYVGIAFTPLALILGYTLLGLPYAVVVLSAALQSFDWDVDRAAQSLGSPWWRRAGGILLPLLRPALMVSLLFAFITAFSELIFALFMRSAYLTTLPVQLWSAVRYDLDPTTAAAAGVTLIASVLAVGIVAVGRMGWRPR